MASVLPRLEELALPLVFKQMALEQDLAEASSTPGVIPQRPIFQVGASTLAEAIRASRTTVAGSSFRQPAGV